MFDKIITSDFFNKILKAGRKLDLNNGGYCDVRLRCMNFWCGPDDKPDEWNVPIKQGELNYPRAFVGTLTFENDKFYVEISPYELNDYYNGKVPNNILDNCSHWVEKKILEIVNIANLMPKSIGTKCPLCDFVLPNDKLLNELIKHIGLHGQVTNIVLGSNTIKVDGKQYKLELEYK
jgi:hypothetical protein